MSVPVKPTILLADDHTLIRDALPAAIRKQIPGAQFLKTANAADTVAIVAEGGCDLVVLDLGLPGGGELETLRRLRTLKPELRILVFSMFPESKMGVPAIDAGADGYLCKTADRLTIAKAVSEILAGQGYASEGLRELLRARIDPRRGKVMALSPRELEVLVSLGHGRSAKEIAADLGIAVSSVGTYRLRIMEKLDLRTSADVVRYVVEHRILRA